MCEVTAKENKKSVLMFCPKFFGYEKRVAQAIRAQGFDVDLYDERPNNGFIAKVSLRLNIKLYRPVVRKYISRVIEENKNKHYDYVFMVKSEAAGKAEIDMLRKAYPDAEFILYLWDSVANVPDGEKKLPLYDRVLTFDPVDAKNYGLKLRPLFYGDEYTAKDESEKTYEYDFAFVGTAHTDRPRIAHALERECLKRDRKCFYYLFLPHPLVFLYNKIRERSYKGISKSDINFNSLKASQITEIYSKSRSILDVEHPKQRGLTMRTIELLGMGKKIITTNKYIKEYDFYNENNICLIDRENPSVAEDFFDREYSPVPQDIMKRYTIEAFVKEILNIKE